MPSQQELLELEKNSAIIAAGFISGLGNQWNWHKADMDWIYVYAVRMAIAIKAEVVLRL